MPIEVELLAVVEPLTPGKVAIYLSEEHAKALAGAAAMQWIMELEPMLARARIPHHSRIGFGAPRKVIADAMRRPDIDRVLISFDRSRWLGRMWTKRRAMQLRRVTPHPVTVVS